VVLSFRFRYKNPEFSKWLIKTRVLLFLPTVAMLVAWVRQMYKHNVHYMPGDYDRYTRKLTHE